MRYLYNNSDLFNNKAKAKHYLRLLYEVNEPANSQNISNNWIEYITKYGTQPSRPQNKSNTNQANVIHPPQPLPTNHNSGGNYQTYQQNYIAIVNESGCSAACLIL